MNLRMRRNQWINDKCILLSASHYLFSTLASWISKPYSCTVKTIDLILHLLCVCVCVRRLENFYYRVLIIVSGYLHNTEVAVDSLSIWLVPNF